PARAARPGPRRLPRGGLASRRLEPVERGHEVLSSPLEVAAERLLALDGGEECLEVAFPERRRPVALDHLEEDRRPVLRRLREDLQQVAVLVARGEGLAPLSVAVVPR